MENDIIAIIEQILKISLVLLSYCFLSMWKILHGSYFSLQPTWKWAQDIRKLRYLAKKSEDQETKKKSKHVVLVLNFTGILLIICMLLVPFQ